MTLLQQIQAALNWHVRVNENFESVGPAGLYGLRRAGFSGLTFAWYGGIFNGNTVADSSLNLTGSTTNYVVANLSTGVVSASTSATNWNDSANYLRLYEVVTGASTITTVTDMRQAYGDGGGGGGGGNPIQCIPVACSDETTDLTTGTSKVTFRMPYAFTLSEVRSSLSGAPAGAALVVDVNENGSSILATKLSIDAGEKTSTTAATSAVISDTSLADDAEITIDVDQVGSSSAGKGLKVYLIGTKT